MTNPPKRSLFLPVQAAIQEAHFSMAAGFKDMVKFVGAGVSTNAPASLVGASACDGAAPQGQEPDCCGVHGLSDNTTARKPSVPLALYLRISKTPAGRVRTIQLTRGPPRDCCCFLDTALTIHSPAATV